jgi:hypothetical protein
MAFACREQLAAPSTDSANNGLLRKSLGQSVGLLELLRHQQQHDQHQPSEFKAKADSEELHPDSSLTLPSLLINKRSRPDCDDVLHSKSTSLTSHFQRN